MNHAQVNQMKIDTATPQLKPPTSGPPAAKPAKTAAVGDQVQLSGVAHLEGNEAPPIDSARVQEIKAAIAEGRFRINPEAIAERLIGTAQELIAAQRRV